MAALHKVFTAVEREALLELFGAHPSIEEKRTDVMSMAKKGKPGRA
jgi:hypothetical protein